MVMGIRAGRSPINVGPPSATAIDTVVIGHSTGVLPVATDIDVAVVHIVVVGSDVDVLGAITDPVPAIPGPLAARPAPRSVDPHMAISWRDRLLLVERLGRKTGNLIRLWRPNSDMGLAIDDRTGGLHGASRGETTHDNRRKCAHCERQSS